jgi:hypothetical protein
MVALCPENQSVKLYAMGELHGVELEMSLKGWRADHAAARECASAADRREILADIPRELVKQWGDERKHGQPKRRPVESDHGSGG